MQYNLSILEESTGVHVHDPAGSSDSPKAISRSKCGGTLTAPDVHDPA